MRKASTKVLAFIACGGLASTRAWVHLRGSMFNVFHPHPVVDRRPAAELSQPQTRPTLPSALYAKAENGGMTTAPPQLTHPPADSQAMSAQALLAQLSALERQLHAPACPQAEALLHPDFVEVGYSGRRYDKAAILALLAAEAPGECRVVAQDFELQWLGCDQVLVLYRSAHRLPDGGMARHSRRSSLWLREPDAAGGGAWRMRFHQGTATEPFDPGMT